MEICSLPDKTLHIVPKYELYDEGVWGEKKANKDFFFLKLKHLPATSVKI